MNSCYTGQFFDLGLKDGRLVNVQDVKNGKACECKCPSCGTPLVAHNNPKNKKAKHFQHVSEISCKYYHETVLHYLAKEIIEENKSLAVPNVCYLLSCNASEYSHRLSHPFSKKIDKTVIRFDKVLVEKSSANFRPDLKCYKNGKEILIEIAVTHFIDDNKNNKIIKNNIPVLEIDLSQFDRNIQRDKLKEILLGNTQYMKWVYNPKIESRFSEAENKTKSIIDFVTLNTKHLKVYGKNHHIFSCPIYKEHYEKVKLEDECYRCPYYVRTMEACYDFDQKPKYPELTLYCIGHKALQYDQLLKRQGVKFKN